MANLMLTESCNLRCPYCFASEFVNKNAKEMPFENYKAAKEWLLNSGEEGFGLIGGEPTVYRHFDKVLDDIIYDDRIKRVTVFTNAINLEKFKDKIICDKFRFLINCNSPEDIGEKSYRRLWETLKLLVHKLYMKDRITLGINIYKENQNFDFFINILKEFGIKDARISVTVPERGKSFNRLEYFKKLKPVLLSFYQALISVGARPHYDCNIVPGCIYTEDELKLIERAFSENKKDFPRLIGECGVCKPVIDILPDLLAVRCFGLSDEAKKPILYFDNLRDLINCFIKDVDFPLLMRENNEDCKNCYKNQCLKCVGGCLAFKR